MIVRRAAACAIAMMILLLTSACESPADTVRPQGRGVRATESDLATSVPVLPTRDLRAGGAGQAEALTSPQGTRETDAPPPLTIAPTASDAMPSGTPEFAVSPAPAIATLPPTFTSPPPTVVIPTASPLPAALFAEFTFGTSVEGRALIGYRIGTGTRMLLLVGAVHGGFEANSAQLVEMLAVHFRENPADVLPGVTLLLIPALNPDGLSRGRVLDGRFNANGVDLNRNWGCGWSPEAYFRDQRVSAGPAAFSEPETAALANLIQIVKPAAALFYHAAADGVFSGDCGGDFGSATLSETYGRAADYGFGADFSAYPVTGTAPAWANSLGIPSADVELSSATDPEFDRNLRGVMAVQYWLAPP